MVCMLWCGGVQCMCMSYCGVFCMVFVTVRGYLINIKYVILYEVCMSCVIVIWYVTVCVCDVCGVCMLQCDGVWCRCVCHVVLFISMVCTSVWWCLRRVMYVVMLWHLMLVWCLCHNVVKSYVWCAWHDVSDFIVCMSLCDGVLGWYVYVTVRWCLVSMLCVMMCGYVMFVWYVLYVGKWWCVILVWCVSQCGGVWYY